MISDLAGLIDLVPLPAIPAVLLALFFIAAELGFRYHRRFGGEGGAEDESQVLSTALLVLALLLGFALAPMLGSGDWLWILVFLFSALFLMGVTFAPMGALLPELFPTHVRYTGASAAYNLGGIVGASAAPFFAQKLVAMGGLSYVGGYVSAAAVLSLIAVLCLKETRNNDLNQVS